MKVRQLRVRNFRGIAKLDWKPSGDTIALIGPGDSGKTTILDALGWVLSPSYWLPVTEADFHDGIVDKPIEIEATVADPPSTLTNFEKFGQQLRGWHIADKAATDDLEPAEEHEEAITLRLTIDESFEPSWRVVKGSDDARISARDRGRLGFFRIDERSDRHLAWGRGSALLSLTESTNEVTAALAEAHREARRTIRDTPPGKLAAAANKAQMRGQAWGVDVRDLKPGLSPTSFTGPSSMVLHDGEVPVTQMGLGSSRSLAMSVQGLGLAGSMVAIDELELGLEPHRLRQLVDRLKTFVAAGGETPAQVMVTTHSSVAITEFALEDLAVVRRIPNGHVQVVAALDAFDDEPGKGQGLARSNPEALLSRVVLVGEGATEVGFLRSVLRHWDSSGIAPIARSGLMTCNGGGHDQAQSRALGFDKLGYPTLLLLDSDVGEPTALNAVDHKVELVQWDGSVSIEQRIALDLPMDLLPDFIEAAVEAGQTEESIKSRLASILDIRPADLDCDPSTWEDLDEVGTGLRDALGTAASKRDKGDRDQGWFKSIHGGEQLGNLVMDNLAMFEGTPLMDGISRLEDYVREACGLDTAPDTPAAGVVDATND